MPWNIMEWFLYCLESTVTVEVYLGRTDPLLVLIIYSEATPLLFFSAEAHAGNFFYTLAENFERYVSSLRR